MILEINKELKQTIQDKKIDFLSHYNPDDIKMWQDENNYHFKNGNKEKLQNLLGVTLYYVAMALNQNKEGQYDEFQNDEIIVSIGLNPTDYKYIYTFAIAIIIEDFENLKLFGKADITEALQIEHIKINDE